MTPELQQIVDTIETFTDKTEAKQWFNENKNEIVTLLADLCEQRPTEYIDAVEIIAESFQMRGMKGVVRETLLRDVKSLLAGRMKERTKDHWQDGMEPPEFIPDKNGKVLPTQQLLVEILLKSKYIITIKDTYSGFTYFMHYGEVKLPWQSTNENLLRIQYFSEHRERNVTEINYTRTDLAYNQAALRYYLSTFFQAELDWKGLKNAIIYVAEENRFNIPQDYFNNALPEYDGVDHYNLLARHAGAHSVEQSRLVMKSIMQGIMARCFEPGYDYRGTVVLVGEENAGKSWFTKQLCIHMDYYLELVFDKYVSHVEVGRNLRGRMVVELADTGGIGTKSANEIKSFLTQQYDNFRNMHENVVQNSPRTCIFIVTTNDMESYLGSSGNTRFLPIEVGKFDMEAIRNEIPQLFAQALYLWRKGVTPRLTENDLILQQEMISEKEIKPNFYYFMLRYLKSNYGDVFIEDASGWQEGVKLDHVLKWLENEMTGFVATKEGYYRREIKNVFKKYFHIETKRSGRAVPVLRRKIVDKPENDYNYIYVGSVKWSDFIESIIE